ncbi:MAG: hypothetical protein FWC13_12295 [Oscillospiraceae bacterium]|nr:hypothetical protein [Oscillospiraceae bacterium]
MGEGIVKLIEVITQNITNPKFWIFIVALFFAFLIIFPILDVNIFYYSRMERRIEILYRIASIDIEIIQANQILYDEYNHIISEIAQQRENAFANIFQNIQIDTSRANVTGKFISGGLLLWVLMICVPFMNTFNNKLEKIVAFFLLLIFGGVLGGIATFIPTIQNIWINYISVNVVVFIGLVSFFKKKPPGETTE